MEQREKEHKNFLTEKQRKEEEIQELKHRRGVDLYLNGKLSKSNWSVPENAVRLFTVEVFYLNAGYIKDSFYLIETDNYIEIWEEYEDRRGVIGRFDKPEGNTKEFIKDFMINVFNGKRLFSEPSKLIHEGYLKENDYNLITDAFEQETKIKNIEDIDDPHGILKTAGDLGLHPIHEGGESDNCIANCPGTDHFIMIVPSSGEWGCGWCKRKGKSEELKRFCDKR